MKKRYVLLREAFVIALNENDLTVSRHKLCNAATLIPSARLHIMWLRDTQYPQLPAFDM